MLKLSHRSAAGKQSLRILDLLSILFLLFTLSPAFSQVLPAAQDCQLIQGGSVLSMAAEGDTKPNPDTDVLVCGTKIQAVGPAGTLESPEGTRRIDARGKVILPGLTDAHVHLFSPLDLELDLAWGVTTVRNMFGNPFNLVMKKNLESGVMWGPRFYTAGPILDGDPPIWPGSAAVSTAEQAQRAVAEQVAAGYDFIKVYSLLDPAPFFAAVEAGHEAHVLVGGHVPNAVPLRDAVEGGMDFIEHLTGFVPALQGEDSPWLALSPEERTRSGRFERLKLQVDGFDAGMLKDVARLMVEHGVWNTPTFVVIERIAANEEQKSTWAKTHPQMRTVSAATLSFWTPANDFRLRDVTDEQLAARRREAELHGPIVKALHDAGAELMLGTDAPNPFVFAGFSVHEELERFVGAGLTPWQALRTATSQPARFLGAEDTFGRVLPGLEADLLVLDANPLDDIRNTQKIYGVMTRGRWLDRSALDAKLSAVAKAYGKE